MRRTPLKRSSDKKHFSRTSRPHPANSTGKAVMRGGKRM